MSRYAIVLADDHGILRQGIKMMIGESPDLEVVGEAGNGTDLLELLKTVKADMVILDVSMPKLDGIGAAKEIKKIHPRIKILMLTMHKGKELLHHALSTGVDGYMLKDESNKELHSAIEKIRQGGVYLSPLLSEEVAEDYVTMCRGGFSEGLKVLSSREREILKLVVDGKSSREIADALFISVHTVEHHRSSIMEKMGVKRMADLVKEALQKGYIS